MFFIDPNETFAAKLAVALAYFGLLISALGLASILFLDFETSATVVAVGLCFVVAGLVVGLFDAAS